MQALERYAQEVDELREDKEWLKKENGKLKERVKNLQQQLEQADARRASTATTIKDTMEAIATSAKQTQNAMDLLANNVSVLKEKEQGLAGCIQDQLMTSGDPTSAGPKKRRMDDEDSMPQEPESLPDDPSRSYGKEKSQKRSNISPKRRRTKQSWVMP